jgi:two-component system sensor kinase FixL
MSAQTFLTEFGLPGIQLVPYGLHTCYFYDSDEHLEAALAQYFAAGVRHRERCIWITAEPFDAARARAALGAKGFDARELERSGALMVKEHSEWYTRANPSRGYDAAAFWLEEEQRALALGFNGIRITGDTRFLTKDSWEAFMEYERAVNNVFGGRRIVALCPYQRRIGATGMLDVLRCHECAIDRDHEGWQVLSGEAPPPLTRAD